MRAKHTLDSAPIAVFDSGVGGLSVLLALRHELPREHFVYVADSAYAPYGERDEADIQARVLAIAHQLLDGPAAPIKALVVACNSATAAAITQLRATYPALAIVGVEPALKTALRHSRCGQIAVMATRATLHSAKFQALKNSLQTGARFTLQACDGLAAAIEHDHSAEIRRLCTLYLRELGFDLDGRQGSKQPFDTVVLGCTHYPFAAGVMRELLGPSVELIDNGVPVARQTRRLLEGRLSADASGSLRLLATGDSRDLAAACQRWLGLQAVVASMTLNQPSPLGAQGTEELHGPCPHGHQGAPKASVNPG